MASKYKQKNDKPVFYIYLIYIYVGEVKIKDVFFIQKDLYICYISLFKFLARLHTQKCVLHFDENAHLSLGEEVWCCLVFGVGNFCNIIRDFVIIYSLLSMKIAFVNNILVNTYMNNTIFTVPPLWINYILQLIIITLYIQTLRHVIFNIWFCKR